MTLSAIEPESAADVEREFPGWEVSAGFDGRIHARFRQLPSVELSKEDLTQLRKALSCLYDGRTVAEALLLLRREARDSSEWHDQMTEMHSRRISALEEALSARWPRRLFLGFRLARDIRVSARQRAGMSWHQRREAYVFEEWLSAR